MQPDPPHTSPAGPTGTGEATGPGHQPQNGTVGEHHQALAHRPSATHAEAEPAQTSEADTGIGRFGSTGLSPYRPTGARSADVETSQPTPDQVSVGELATGEHVEATTQDVAEAVAEQPAAEPVVVLRQPYNPLRYWLRPLILSVLVVILLGLTYWDQHRVPDRPVAPDVLTATPQAGATVSASDPGLVDTLARLRTALQRRDARALANLSDPDGLTVAAYGGAIPDTGYTVTDTTRFSQDVLNGAKVSLLGWRTDGRGRVIVLADGFAQRPLRLSANSTLELTSLTGLGLASRAGTWYVRWVLPDSSGVLAQQARSLVWQPWPNP